MDRGKFEDIGGAGRRALSGLTALALLAVPAPAFATETPQPFSAPSDPEAFERALRCLTEAVYYEARSEADDGQRAVAQVVLNRVRHPSYPNSVCGVVYQGSERRTGCQFTFTCDGSISGWVDGSAWARAERVARAALRGSVYRAVGLALNYHTTAIRPYWAPSLVRHAVIGAHIFYRRPDSGSVAAFWQAPAQVEPGAGYAPDALASRTARRQRIEPATARYAPARVELARVERYAVERVTVERVRVERPRVERATIERPAGIGRAASRPASTGAVAAVRQPTLRAAPAHRGPRTTLESGVRVARGS